MKATTAASLKVEDVKGEKKKLVVIKGGGKKKKRR